MKLLLVIWVLIEIIMGTPYGPRDDQQHQNRYDDQYGQGGIGRNQQQQPTSYNGDPQQGYNSGSGNRNYYPQQTGQYPRYPQQNTPTGTEQYPRFSQQNASHARGGQYPRYPQQNSSQYSRYPQQNLTGHQYPRYSQQNGPYGTQQFPRYPQQNPPTGTEQYPRYSQQNASHARGGQYPRYPQQNSSQYPRYQQPNADFGRGYMQQPRYNPGVQVAGTNGYGQFDQGRNQPNGYQGNYGGTDGNRVHGY